MIQGPIQRRSGRALLRSLSGGRKARRLNFCFATPPGGMHTKSNLMAELAKGETQLSPNTIRTRRMKRCSWSMRRPAATRSVRRANFTSAIGLTGVDRDQARRQRQRRHRGRDPGRTWNSDAFRRHRRKARRFRAIRSARIYREHVVRADVFRGN